MQRSWELDLNKLNKMEHIKLAKDGLDILKEIKTFARTGLPGIKQEDLDLLKWAGVYAQRPRTDGYFMVRVKLPSGRLHASQASVLAAIAADYGRGQVQLTTRQAVQFHWIRLENLPDIFSRLAASGLSSTEACGDCPRTVSGNPLAGIDPDELLDTMPLVEELVRFFEGNRAFSNLPRKFKISVSASPYNSGHAEINDLAFVPAVKEIGGSQVNGFHVLVGGGLSVKPHLAEKLDIFVRPDEVLKIAVAVATLFREYGYREQRSHCRLKFLVADWGAARFRDEVLKITGALPTAGKDLIRSWNGGFYYGVHRQKQEGLFYAGLNIPGGQLTDADLDSLGQCAGTYGDGTLRTTHSQNIIIANIPGNAVELLQHERLLQKFSPAPQPFMGHAVTCTGNRYCNLALVETQERLQKITEYLDRKVAIDMPVRIHITGCPNACAQPQIADIGLQGAVLKRNGRLVECFEIAVGGMLGPEAGFAGKLQGRVAADDAAEVIARMIEAFKANRREGETVGKFVRRTGVERFQTILDSARAE